MCPAAAYAASSVAKADDVSNMLIVGGVSSSCPLGGSRAFSAWRKVSPDALATVETASGSTTHGYGDNHG